MFNINQSYDFSTLAASLLGATYRNMKVIGIVGMDEAVKYADVVTKHLSAQAVIQGLPASPRDLTYVIFRDPNGNAMVMAQEYIDPNTVVMVSTINLRVDIYNVDSAMHAVINTRLRELGITDFTITPV